MQSHLFHKKRLNIKKRWMHKNPIQNKIKNLWNFKNNFNYQLWLKKIKLVILENMLKNNIREKFQVILNKNKGNIYKISYKDKILFHFHLTLTEIIIMGILIYMIIKEKKLIGFVDQLKNKRKRKIKRKINLYIIQKIRIIIF